VWNLTEDPLASTTNGFVDRWYKGPARESIPPVVFTQEALEIIHRLDAVMFDEFGYQKADVATAPEK
jgi:hypothetical protein